jgi:hypothetical protein
MVEKIKLFWDRKELMLKDIDWDENPVSKEYILTGHITDIKIYVSQEPFQKYFWVDLITPSVSGGTKIEANSMDELKDKISEYVASYILNEYFSPILKNL